MNQEQCKCYGFGYSGCNFLSVNRSVYTQSELLPNGIVREIICDKDDKWMKVRERKAKNRKNWNKLKLNGLQRGVTIDLNENGDRWEGDSLNGNPFGYGCAYNSENQIIYSGFIYEGLKVCYGTEMYGDVGLVEYEGGYYKGMRFGDGKLYNKKKELMYEGEWKENQSLSELSSLHVDSKLDENDIHFGLEEIVIGENGLQGIEFFRLIGFNNLKILKIENNCLVFMRSFCIEDCNELVDVQLHGNDSYHCNDDSIRLFRIRNCSQLIKIIIGCGWYTCHVHIEFICIE